MPLNPDLAEVIDAAFDRRLLDLHTCMPGRVHEYDAATQIAVVQPLIQSIEYSDRNGRTAYKLPMLPSVPVLWPRAGGYALHLPLKRNDQVLLVFCESDIGMWRANQKIDEIPSGGSADPQFTVQSLSRHALGDCFAIPGISPDPEPLEGTSDEHATLITPTGGKLKISSAGGTVEAVALAERLKASLVAAIDAGIAAAPGGGGTDGGAAALNALKGAIAAWGPTDVGAASLEAE